MPVSFVTDIRPLFRDSPDMDSMQGYGLDLTSYEEARARASEIYARLADGSMPYDEPWPPEHPNPACRAYTDLLLRTAWHASLGETIAAMTPCMRLYAYLGRELARKCSLHHPYRRWIETYSGEEFGRLARRLETLLDRVAADNREIRDSYR